jgi:integrase
MMTVVGKTGEREVLLSRAAVEALGAVPKVEGVPWVFAGRVHGKHLVGVGKQLDRVCKAAGVTRFPPYVFRHSAATLALAGGADVRAVQALLGHADLATTAIYLHSNEKRERAAVETVAGIAKGI